MTEQQSTDDLANGEQAAEQPQSHRAPKERRLTTTHKVLIVVLLLVGVGVAAVVTLANKGPAFTPDQYSEADKAGLAHAAWLSMSPKGRRGTCEVLDGYARDAYLNYMLKAQPDLGQAWVDEVVRQCG